MSSGVKAQGALKHSGHERKGPRSLLSSTLFQLIEISKHVLIFKSSIAHNKTELTVYLEEWEAPSSLTPQISLILAHKNLTSDPVFAGNMLCKPS